MKTLIGIPQRDKLLKRISTAVAFVEPIQKCHSPAGQCLLFLQDVENYLIKCEELEYVNRKRQLHEGNELGRALFSEAYKRSSQRI